jgi:hypothetical protein
MALKRKLKAAGAGGSAVLRRPAAAAGKSTSVPCGPSPAAVEPPVQRSGRRGSGGAAAVEPPPAAANFVAVLRRTAAERPAPLAEAPIGPPGRPRAKQSGCPPLRGSGKAPWGIVEPLSSSSGALARERSRTPRTRTNAGGAVDVVSYERSSSDGGKGLQRTKVTDGRAHGRLPYTAEEDADMINWVKGGQEADPLSGRSSQGTGVWKAAERAGITRHGWMSMHNRWRRHIASGHAANPTALMTQQEGVQGGCAASSIPLRAAPAASRHVVGGAASSPPVGSAASSYTPSSPVPLPLLAQAATAEPQAHPTSTRAVAEMLA